MTALEELEIKQEQLGERISLLRDDIIPELETSKEKSDHKILHSFYEEARELQFQYDRNEIELKHLFKRASVAVATNEDVKTMKQLHDERTRDQIKGRNLFNRINK
jgi:hypothetical protein